MYLVQLCFVTLLKLGLKLITFRDEYVFVNVLCILIIRILENINYEVIILFTDPI